MIDNAPVMRFEHAGLTIEGYSRAAVQTYWRVPELKLGFDLGIQPWSFMGTPTWFLSHCHLDHAAALPVYVLRGGMRPEVPVRIPPSADYIAYVAQATHNGWHHQLYAWTLQQPLPRIPVPLLGHDRAVIDLARCFREAYDRTAADDEADYLADPPQPALRPRDRRWVHRLLCNSGIRP